MSTEDPQVPGPLQSNTIEARLIKQEIWDRMWEQNDHFMCVIVGREGSGKSHTGIKLAELVDPTFNAERVMFDPVEFLKKLREWKENNETKGKMVVIDEAGVGVGVRSWYDKDQIRLNQVLQIIRDENMGVIFTLPRLEELDSQTEGRLHSFMEMTQMKEGEWALLKWFDWDPTRDGRNEIYREYPKMTIDGWQRPIKRLRISPPSSDIVKNYEGRKSEFQDREYAEAIDEMEDDVDDEQSVKDVAMEIADGDLSDYVSQHSQNNTAYINPRLIAADYDLSQNDSQAVKDLLQRQFSEEEIENHA